MSNMLLLVVQEAEHAAGGTPTPFAVNTGLVVWTWVVFIVLLFLLSKYAFPAILKATEDRERAIAKQLEEAHTANTEAQALLAENRRMVAEARTTAQTMLADAKAGAERERAASVEKTRQEQDELLARARRELQAERDKAVAELRREAVDLSLAAATRLIGQRLDSAADRALVEGYLNSLETSN